MPKIIKLEQHVADLIAAGEVVTRPASVVKELVENSIDAGASFITVEIEAGGMSLIRVTDNGCGIDEEDAQTAFLRHATSKLHDAKGLETIKTLGFRGEALAAISAVSRIELVTRTGQSDNAIRLRLEASVPSGIIPAGAPAGTSITVRDLFFNTPARAKFMKTDRAESSAVSCTLRAAALSRPDISFRYIKDGKTEFHTPGDSKPDSCIYSLFGKDFIQGLIPADLSDEGISVTGFVSNPGASRGNRSYQFFFINSRVIRSVLLQSAIEQAYRRVLTAGHYPACVLYISTVPGNVDVNVHPAKLDVRFLSDKQIFDGVYYAALRALDKDGVISRSTDVPQPAVNIPAVNFNQHYLPNKDIRADSQTGDCRHTYNPVFSGASRDKITINHMPDTRDRPAAMPLQPVYMPAQPAFSVIGEVFSTYIIIEFDNNIWFIDKHAAHERIQYNLLSGSDFNPMSQTLISPVYCRICSPAVPLIPEHIDFLDGLGFSADNFSDDTVTVRSIPSYINIDDVESVISEICVYLETGGTATPECLDNIYKTLACKVAVKAGSNSDILEMEALAARVISGEITHCPHGRPITFQLTKNTLEKNFKRI